MIGETADAARDRAAQVAIDAIRAEADDVTCADCGWLAHFGEMYRVKYPNDRRPERGVHGFYLCVNCWDRLCGAAVMEAFR